MTGSADVEHLCLYNRQEFSELNIVEPQAYQRIDCDSEERLVGSLAGVREADIFTSGFSAGFGGPDLLRDRERLENIITFTERSVSGLAATGVRLARVRAKPLHYSENEHYVQFALLRNSFVVEEENLTFYLDLTQWRTAEQYLESLRHAPKRQLRLALARGFAWHEARSEEDWTAGYDVLAQSRARHGAQLSLSEEYIFRLREAFPKRIRLFSLEGEEGPIAACLTYLIRPGHAQVMFWGDRVERQLHVPKAEGPVAVMNLVAYRMVEQGITEALRTVDLGTSTSSQVINYGNCAFKTSIGALPDFRRTFVKTL